MILKQKQFIVFAFLCFGNFIHGQTLHEYIAEAIENNPQIKAVTQKYKASLEQVNAARSLPNTTIGAGYFVRETETRTGAQKAKFSAEQKIPWFGTLKAREENAIAISDIDKNTIEVAKRKITLQIKKSYYTLYGLKAKKEIYIEQKKLLEYYKEILLIALENDKATTIDILKVTVAQNELNDKIEVTKGKILNAEVRFNKILDRDGFEDLVVPDNLIIPEEEPTMVLSEIAYHPELLKYDLENLAIQKQEKVNSKESLPSLSLGLDYIIVEERPNQEFIDNGTDSWMPKVSLSIPLFTKKYKTKEKTLKIEEEGIEYQRSSVENALEQLLEEAINDRITTRINYDTQQKNIKQTKEIEKITLVAYQANRIEFNELLEIQQMLLSFESKKIEAIQNYFIQTAIINYLS